jgi:CheY-like chemotaxis protein
MSAGTQPAARILIIDDDRDVVSYLETVLRDAGYTTVGTTSSSEGLKLARQLKPDLICLDIVMPEPTGVRVFRELRDDAELAGIPVVMITGVLPQFKEFIHHRKRVPPPDGYIAKPFEVGELLSTVERVLGAPASV